MKNSTQPKVVANHDDFLADVLEGLTQKPKTLKPKYFYDNKGAQLFTEICDAPEGEANGAKVPCSAEAIVALLKLTPSVYVATLSRSNELVS